MDKYEKRLYGILAADQSEWQRLVEENPDLQKELQDLGKEFSFPLPGFYEFFDWLDRNPQAEQAFNKKLRLILSKHGIFRDDWLLPLWYRVALGSNSPVGPFRMGFPSGRWYRKNGQSYHELIIDDQVDVANPIIQTYILQMQRVSDAPPKPLPMKNDKRKLDWRPVWEWHKKHPEIGMNDLARLLGYERSYLSRKLNGLEDLK